MTEKQKTQKGRIRKNKGLFILAAVLVLLLAVYFGLRAWNKSEEKRREEADKAAEIHVTDTAADDIVSMSFDVGSGEMAFSRTDGKWYYTPDADFPLAQSYPEDMAAALGNITADRKLEDGDSLADYGLEGITYEINEDGEIELLDTGLDASQTPSSGLNQALCYVPNAASTDPVLKKDTQTQLLNDIQEFSEDYAVFNPATKYLLSSDANAENGTELTQILEDARTQYICGAIDEAGRQAQWDEWARRGGEQMIQEVNELYQADQNK